MLRFQKAKLYRNLMESADDTDCPVELEERWGYVDELEGKLIIKCVHEFDDYYEVTFQNKHVEPCVHAMHIGTEQY
jgi:hypothetical protein